MKKFSLLSEPAQNASMQSSLNNDRLGRIAIGLGRRFAFHTILAIFIAFAGLTSTALANPVIYKAAKPVKGKKLVLSPGKHGNTPDPHRSHSLETSKTQNSDHRAISVRPFDHG